MNFDGTLRWTCPIGSNQCCPAISQDEDGHEVIYLYGKLVDVDGAGQGRGSLPSTKTRPAPMWICITPSLITFFQSVW